MKVLVVTNMYPTERDPSWGTFVKTQVDSLRNLGVEIDVLHIEGTISKLNYLRGIARVRRRVMEQPYDLVHAHYGLSGLVARAQWRRPLLVSFCGDDLYGHANEAGVPHRRSLPLAWIHRQLSRYVRGAIVKSQAMADLLPVAAAVIPNGVDFDTFRPMSQDECRRELGLDPARRVVLFPYNPARTRKNYAGVVQAVEQLNSDGEGNVDVLVVRGEPNHRLPVYMNAADVMVLASCWEGSPNAVKEALACNTPIVSTDVGDVRELLEGVSNSRLCDRDPGSIAAALAQVLAGPPDSDGRERISRLRIEAVAHQVLNEYGKLVPEGR